jgi:hypothetical protein
MTLVDLSSLAVRDWTGRNPQLGWTVLLLLASASVSGQTGQLTGKVTDRLGGAVPDVQVTVLQPATGTRRVTSTSRDGFYSAASLQPGAYTITLEHAGFKTLEHSALQLEVDQIARVDFVLELGSIAEEVFVSGAAPVLSPDTQAVGQVIRADLITGLPLLGRDAYALGELSPGVRISRGMNDLPVDMVGTSSVSINGAQGNTNEFLLDGAPNSSPAQNQPILYPNADSVEEFSVETNNYHAEYGRAAGGVFNVVTKSGSNSRHFTLYEFLRNDKLDANNWFANLAGQPQPALRFNQFGGVVGGPVIVPRVYDGHNRTFFFLAEELVRYIQGVTYTATVPNPLKLSGNFSSDLNASGQPVQIYNPYSSRPNGTGFARDPFPSNVIPPTMMNPVATAMAAYFPAPNTLGSGPTHQNNYVRTASNNIQKNTYSARLDHHFSQATRAFLRSSYDGTPLVRASPYGTADAGAPAFGPQDFRRYNAVAEFDHVFSSSLLGSIRASYSRLTNLRTPVNGGFDIATLGLPAGLASEIGRPAAFPVIEITGYGVSSSPSGNSATWALGETSSIALATDNYALAGDVVKTARAHDVKIGGEVRVIRFNTQQVSDDSTNFSFTSAFTQGPNAGQPSPTGGDALASFLLGTPTSGSVTPSPAVAMQTEYFAAYAQDNWKITSRLTLNLGIRYEIETPRTERYNRLTNFNYASPVPLNAPGLSLSGTLGFPGTGGLPRGDANLDANNFAPRLGFAWSIAPRTVMRGGAGLFYGDNWGGGNVPTSYGISGFSAATTMVTSLDAGVTPFNTLTNPYPNGLNPATGSTLGPATLLGQSVAFYDRGNVTPYTIQWDFDIQRELPHGVLLDAAYVGTRGLKLPLNLTLNQLPDFDLKLGSALQKSVTNPFYGQIAAGLLSSPTVALAELLVPYPQFSSVTSDLATWGASSYHAWQVKLERRYGRGFSTLISYTYSKMMDDSAGPFGGETLGGGAIQDWNDLKAEWSTSTLDQTHRLIFQATYALPRFATRRKWVANVAGGWELAIVGSFYSGGPLGITSATNGTDSQGGGQRPDWTGVNPALNGPSLYRWFNTSVFSTPPAYTFGNTPRTFNGTRSDWTRGVDASLHKNLPLNERLVLQFRADAFNLSNTVVFAPPNTTYGSAAFGTVSAQANQPRIVQMGLKLIF